MRRLIVFSEGLLNGRSNFVKGRNCGIKDILKFFDKNWYYKLGFFFRIFSCF